MVPYNDVSKGIAEVIPNSSEMLALQIEFSSLLFLHSPMCNEQKSYIFVISKHLA